MVHVQDQWQEADHIWIKPQLYLLNIDFHQIRVCSLMLTLIGVMVKYHNLIKNRLWENSVAQNQHWIIMSWSSGPTCFSRIMVARVYNHALFSLEVGRITSSDQISTILACPLTKLRRIRVRSLGLDQLPIILFLPQTTKLAAAHSRHHQSQEKEAALIA